MSLSHDHRLVAFGVDLKNNENLHFGLRDIKNKAFLSDYAVENCSNIKFNIDNQSFFYVKVNEKRRPFKVFYHKIGENMA
jgi:oligopeptidase B